MDNTIASTFTRNGVADTYREEESSRQHRRPHHRRPRFDAARAAAAIGDSLDEAGGGEDGGRSNDGINNGIDAPPPKVPVGYVEPALFGCAHLVYVDPERPGSKLFLGPKEAASVEAGADLRREGVGGIVNCTDMFPCHHRRRYAGGSAAAGEQGGKGESCGGIRYCQVPVYDIESADILSYLDGATTFIHAILTQGQSVLVHCAFGVSRSATVVIAYLMRYGARGGRPNAGCVCGSGEPSPCEEGGGGGQTSDDNIAGIANATTTLMTREEAYVATKLKRPVACPNRGFWRQLKLWEEWLVEAERNHLERRQQQVGGNGEGGASGDDFGDEGELFDAAWASQCNVSFTTCRELPGSFRREQDCWKRLSRLRARLRRKGGDGGCSGDEDSEVVSRLLSVCLDFIWGRGVMPVDVEWLSHVCHLLDDHSDGHDDTGTGATKSVLETSIAMVQDPDSDFCLMWSGEIYPDQVSRVVRTLSSSLSS